MSSIHFCCHSKLPKIALPPEIAQSVQYIDAQSIQTDYFASVNALMIPSTVIIDTHFLKRFPNLQLIGSATSGIDHIDIKACLASNVQIVSAKGANANAVADYILLSLLHLFGGFDNRKTVGIIGFGCVGQLVYRRFKALGFQVLCCDPYRNEAHLVDLEQVLQCDIITLHCSLTKDGEFSSYQLLNSQTLTKVKSDATIINTARGQVVNANDLMRWKASNKQATLICDVWANEPNIDLNYVQTAEIATPHIAGYSQMAKMRAVTTIWQQFCDFFGIAKIAMPSEQSQIVKLQDCKQLIDFDRYRQDLLAKNFTKCRNSQPLRPELHRVRFELPYQDLQKLIRVVEQYAI